MELLFLEPARAWAFPLAVLVYLLWRVLRRRHYVSATTLSFLARVAPRPSPLRRLPALLLFLAFALITLAAMEPVLPFSQREVESQGLDIAIVLDLSASMQEVMNRPRPSKNMSILTFTSRDRAMSMQPEGETRLQTTKEALRHFISRRRDDRIALVVFSDHAYVVSPLTFDYDYLLHYVDMVDERILRGEGMTAIGDGLGLANYLLAWQRGEERRSQVIMVFTDGEHNIGRDPVEVLSEADAARTRVHLVGVDLEEELKEKESVRELIAAVGGYGGRYFDADTEAQLLAASAELDSMEKGRLTSKEYVRHAPVYHWFALPALVLLAAALALRAVPYFADFT